MIGAPIMLTGPSHVGEINRRALELFEQHRRVIFSRTDQMFAVLMLVQWLAGIAAALWISPRTWLGAIPRVHEHVWLAVFLGGALAAAPVALAIVRPGWWATRHAAAVAQAGFSSLLIHLSGGRIETHFHVFGSLAFLSFYRDWRVIVTATALIAGDHFARNTWAPRTAFGAGVVSPFRWMEHVAWVAFEDVFLLVSCAASVREMRRIASQQARLEEQHAAVEHEVGLRTAELRQSRQAAEQASQAKSEFLANMSHEIRTPMTGILGYAELLNEPSQSDEDRRHAAATIRRNGEHLLAILNDILDISKIEAGHMRIEPLAVSPRALVEEVCALLHVRAAGKGIALAADGLEALPACVRTDPTRLRQVLLNIVGNAVKFTQAGGVTIAASFQAGESESPGRLRFDVIDTGIGMTPEEASRIFTAFAQADTSTSRRFGGTGLGLSISRRLTEMLGGSISVVSERGRGSTFTVTIATEALAEDALGLGAPPALPMAPAPPAPAAGVSLTGVRILLAEDGPDNQRLLSFHLRRAGAELEVASTGVMALDRLLDPSAPPPDVCLMDMQMPEMDGRQATMTARAAGVRVPIIALTAHAMEAERARCLSAGCDDFLTKPIDRKALIAACVRWADAGRDRDAVPASTRAKAA